MTDQEISEHKIRIDNMTQEEMAQLWRFIQSSSVFRYHASIVGALS